MTPSELTIGLLARDRSFRLMHCTSLLIEADESRIPVLAERLPEIGRGGVLREYLLGPIPLLTFTRLMERQPLRISACGVTHKVRPDERAALVELLRQLEP